MNESKRNKKCKKNNSCILNNTHYAEKKMAERILLQVYSFIDHPTKRENIGIFKCYHERVKRENVDLVFLRRAVLASTARAWV
jgi:hypothetical protein